MRVSSPASMGPSPQRQPQVLREVLRTLTATCGPPCDPRIVYPVGLVFGAGGTGTWTIESWVERCRSRRSVASFFHGFAVGSPAHVKHGMAESDDDHDDDNHTGNAEFRR
jgi:hypothetical protein